MTPVATKATEKTEAIKRRLHDLEGRVRVAKARHEPPPSQAQDRGAAMGQALKLATEMIAGVAVAAAWMMWMSVGLMGCILPAASRPGYRAARRLEVRPPAAFVRAPAPPATFAG